MITPTVSAGPESPRPSSGKSDSSKSPATSSDEGDSEYISYSDGSSEGICKLYLDKGQLFGHFGNLNNGGNCTCTVYITGQKELVGICYCRKYLHLPLRKSYPTKVFWSHTPPSNLSRNSNFSSIPSFKIFSFWRLPSPLIIFNGVP